MSTKSSVFPKIMTAVALTVLFALGLAAGNAFAATTATIAASPNQGISPASVVLTLSSTEAAACTASGSWSGTKPVSGTETVVARVDSTYTLTCTNSTGSATATWTAPTLNTDGSTIPASGRGSLAGFKLFHAPTAGGVATAGAIAITNPAARSFVITGLPVGQRFYAMSAVNAEGIESVLSTQATNVVVLPSVAASASVTVNVRPQPPTLVTVAQVVFDMKNGRVNKYVGTVELGVPCGAYVGKVGKRRYYEVPRSAVTITRPARNTRLVARCVTA